MIPAILSLAALAAAAPAPRAAPGGPTDVQILNYALTLEHLENAFYKMGLQNFTKDDFCKAGASENFYDNLKEISYDEQTHVSFLSGALGSAATQPCTYAFGVTDASSFLATAQILEGVGVSAYLGAAQFIMTPAYLTAAGSILTVESRHSAYLRDNTKKSPFPAPFDIPLDFSEVYSLAAQFITACPQSNPALPVKQFPAIAVAPGTPAKAGDVLTFTVVKSVAAKAAYFITSSGPVQAKLEGSGTTYKVTVPATAQPGQEYVVLTSAVASPTDDNIVAGPAIVDIQDNISSGKEWKGHGKGHGWKGKGGKGKHHDVSSSGSSNVQEIGDGQPQVMQESADGQIIHY